MGFMPYQDDPNSLVPAHKEANLDNGGGHAFSGNVSMLQNIPNLAMINQSANMDQNRNAFRSPVQQNQLGRVVSSPMSQANQMSYQHDRNSLPLSAHDQILVKLFGYHSVCSLSRCEIEFGLDWQREHNKLKRISEHEKEECLREYEELELLCGCGKQFQRVCIYNNLKRMCRYELFFDRLARQQRATTRLLMSDGSFSRQQQATGHLVMSAGSVFGNGGVYASSGNVYRLQNSYRSPLPQNQLGRVASSPMSQANQMPPEDDPNYIRTLLGERLLTDIGERFDKVDEYDELKQRHNSLAHKHQATTHLVMSGGSVVDNGGGRASSGNVLRQRCNTKVQYMFLPTARNIILL